jgi:hypothetical protein
LGSPAGLARKRQQRERRDASLDSFVAELTTLSS